MQFKTKSYQKRTADEFVEVRFDISSTVSTPENPPNAQLSSCLPARKIHVKHFTASL